MYGLSPIPHGASVMATSLCRSDCCQYCNALAVIRLSGIYPVRLYADPETTVGFKFARNGSAGIGSVVAMAAISGYLLDCGSGTGCPLP